MPCEIDCMFTPANTMINMTAAMTKTAAPFQNSGSRYLERRFNMAKSLRGHSFLCIALDQKGRLLLLVQTSYS